MHSLCWILLLLVLPVFHLQGKEKDKEVLIWHLETCSVLLPNKQGICFRQLDKLLTVRVKQKMPEKGRKESKILIEMDLYIVISSLCHYRELIMVRISFLRPLMTVLWRYGNLLMETMKFSPWLLLFARIVTMNIFQLNGLHQRCWRMHRL